MFKIIVLLALLSLARAQVCLYRLAVSIPNANSSISVTDDSSNKVIYELQNFDVTPYYEVPCSTNVQYSFYAGSTLLTTAKNTPAPGSISSLVLLGLMQGTITAEAFTDDWNVTEGTALVRYINVAPNSGSFTIQANGTTFEPNIEYSQTTEYASFPSNLQYAFYVTSADSSKIVLDEFLFLNDQTSYTMWIQGQPGNLELTMTQDYPPDAPSP